MPLVKQKYRICKKCECIGGIFYAQERSDRPTKLNIHSICILCKREENRESYHRCYSKKPEEYYKRSRKYIMSNLKLVNKKRREKRMKKSKCNWYDPENIFLSENL